MKAVIQRVTSASVHVDGELIGSTPYEGALEELLEQNQNYGLAAQNPNGSWRLTPRGFMVSTRIIADLQMAQENSKPLTRIF